MILFYYETPAKEGIYALRRQWHSKMLVSIAFSALYV